MVLKLERLEVQVVELLEELQEAKVEDQEIHLQLLHLKDKMVEALVLFHNLQLQYIIVQEVVVLVVLVVQVNQVQEQEDQELQLILLVHL